MGSSARAAQVTPWRDTPCSLWKGAPLRVSMTVSYLTLSGTCQMPRPLGLRSLQILHAIQAGDAYGLELVARTGLPSGTVYPVLGRLKRSGLVRSHWEDQRRADRDGRPRRRYYELSPAGARALSEGAERIVGLAATLAPGRVGGR